MIYTLVPSARVSSWKKLQEVNMSRGRKRHVDRPVKWTLNIRESLAGQVAVLLSDPVTGKPKAGARSKLINRLLAEWLEEQKRKYENQET
jgi:hypothetical protein